MFFFKLKRMKFSKTSFRFYILFLLFHLGLFRQEVLAQFVIDGEKKKDVISFDLVNNLVVVPITLNGVELSFLLDTGVNNTLLFGVTTKDSIAIKNATPIGLRGLGGVNQVRALKSSANTFAIGDATDINHDLYVVFEEQFDFSKRMGIPIHGILGYQFFKDFIVKTNYTSKKLTFYDSEKYKKRTCRKCEYFDLEFFKNKPYVAVQLGMGSAVSKVLIDSGSSDALWLFDEANYIQESPKNYFEDFLGLSISGSIYGKRSKIKSLQMQGFVFENLTVAFPEITMQDSVSFFKNRKGSIGSEILKRFTVTMNYGKKQMTLKRNRNYKNPFYYNLSGLTLSYDGSMQVKELQDVRSEGLSISKPGSDAHPGQASIVVDPVYSLFTAPKVVVAEIRPDSPAARAGLQVGDGIIKINGVYCYKYKLYELIALLSSKAGRKIRVSYERGDVLLKTSFVLEKVL